MFADLGSLGSEWLPWLDEVTKTISSYWRRKNERRKGSLQGTDAAALALNYRLPRRLHGCPKTCSW